MKPLILILDDDTQTIKFLQVLLTQDYSILSFPCKNQNPVELIGQHKPACVLVDSFSHCKAIKTHPSTASTPVIVLSSQNKSADIAEGLNLGAEDFITKPFDPKELQLRIRSHLKTVQSAMEAKTLKVGPLELDNLERTATYSGKILPLTLTEFDILRLLVSRKGKVVSREEIMKVIWKESASETTDRTIDVHIRALRKKSPELTRHILSVYGVGYQYVE